MIEITYLNGAGLEEKVSFESYDAFNRSQQVCQINIADHFKVTKLMYNKHKLNFKGSYGEIFFYLLNQDLSQYE